jgi:SNF2 family DNA or RNA helicase
LLVYKPEPHQTEAIKYGGLHHYFILADDMGLGKTFEAVAIYISRAVGSFLVVCPASLKYNWEAELLACQSKFHARDILVVEDLSDVKRIFLHDYKVVIINYEMLLELALMEILFAKFKNVIADEAHYLKNINATRTKAFHQYIQDFKPYRLILLTGTPVKNRVDEFYSLFLLCSYNKRGTSGKSIEGMNFYHFQEKFMKSRRKGYGKHKEYYGLRNLEELEEIKKDKYLRRESFDIRGSKIQDVYVTMTPDESDDDDLLKEFEAFQKGVAVDIRAKVKSARLMAPLTLKYLKELHASNVGPIVVFTAHLEPLEILTAGLVKMKGISVGRIDASMSVKKRQEQVDLLQEGRLDFLLGTFGTMSVGYTMIKSCNVVFNDQSWVPGDNDQAKMRIDRMGQDKGCTAHHITGSRVTKYIAKKCNEKIEVIGRVT